MEYFEKSFSSEEYSEELKMLEQFEDEFKEQFNLDELEGDRCSRGGRCFCYFAGMQAIRSAIQFEDAIKRCLIRLCQNGMSPEQFVNILDKLCCVEMYLVEKLKAGKAMADC